MARDSVPIAHFHVNLSEREKQRALCCAKDIGADRSGEE